MQIDFNTLSGARAYHLMTQCIVPRPIAWVLTENEDKEKQNYNLAPFSYFNAVASSPPTVMISIGVQGDGRLKDTLINIKRDGKMVIHIASASHLKALNDSSATLRYGDSEIAHSSLETTQFDYFSLPRLADAKVALACNLDHIHSINNSSQSIVFARIEQAYFDDSIVKKDAKDRTYLDESCINPLARLGSNHYALLGEYKTLKRPD